MKKILFILLFLTLALGQYTVNSDLLVKGDVSLEGDTNDANEGTIDLPSVTADRTYTLPDRDVNFGDVPSASYPVSDAELVDDITVTSTNDITTTGNVGAVTFTGDGSALTGIATGTGGIVNSGSTTIGADSTADGSGEIALQTREITRLTVENAGDVNVVGQFIVDERIGVNTDDPHSSITVDGDMAFFGRLPQALVTFSFDDGYISDYTVMKPLFAAQGEVGCSAIIDNSIGDGGRMSGAQIVELEDAGWEILAHTKTHANLRDSTESVIRSELTLNKATLEALGLTINNLVYPYTFHDELSRRVTRELFRSGRGGGTLLNPQVLHHYGLNSVNGDTPADSSTYKAWIDSAESQSKWLIFYIHSTDATDSLMIESLINYVQSKSISIVTINQGLDLIGNPIEVGDAVSISPAGINLTGELGLNTQTPTTTMEVIGSESDGETFISVKEKRSTTGDLAGIRFSTINAGYYKSFIAHMETSTNGAGDMVFVVDTGTDAADAVIGDEKMRLTRVGDLGIGTTLPTHTFNIYHTDPWVVLTDNTTNKNISTVAQMIDSACVYIEASSTPSLGFRGADGVADASEITINTADQMLFNNASGGYTFDGWIGVNGTLPKVVMVIIQQLPH